MFEVCVVVERFEVTVARCEKAILLPIVDRLFEILKRLIAISLERIQTIGEAIEKYNVVNGRLPARLQDLVPYYVPPALLTDPWGNGYKYLQQPQRYLVIGFTPDGKADTDLFLSRNVEAGATASAPTKQERGGITLID